MQKLRLLVALLLPFGLFLCLFWSPACAEDDTLPPERPTILNPPPSSQPRPGLFRSSLWLTLDKHFQELSPTWQRRYQELRSIAEDTDSAGSQLPPLLSELKRKFLQAQQKLVFLLLDLAPSTMEAMDNYYLICRLEEWEWYLADPVRHVTMVEQTMATYAGVLREVGEALARPRTADTPANAALLEAMPELRSVHALLEARVAYLEASIAPWLQPARTMTEQIQTALASTRMVQPRLWVNYYTLPLRFTQLGWARKWAGLHEIGTTLARGEIFPRPSVLGAVVGVFILGGFTLLFRALEKQSLQVPASDASPRTTSLASGSGDSSSASSLWRVLGMALHAQSAARKCALAVGAVCAANFFLDATPAVHVHIPFLIVQGCLLLVSVAVWARHDKADPPLHLLLLPVITGYLLLEGDAAPLWILGGMIATQGCCTLGLLLQRQRSVFAQIWLCALVLGLLLSVIGFARLTALGLGALLFCRAAFVVLRILYQLKALHQQPLRLCFLLPLVLAWLYSMGMVLGLSYTGLDVMWDYAQAEVLQALGIHVQLRDIFLLLALGLSLLAFGALSHHMLHKVATRRSVLDSSAVPVIHAVVNSLLWVLFVLFSLGLLGVDMRSLAFIGGALTVGIGLGLQNIISNFFSGLVIIFARVVRGGDTIEVGTVRGRVHSVNMRATVVETLEGATLLIPNVEMLNSRLFNWTRNNRHVREDVRVQLTAKNDVEAVMRLMQEVAARHGGIVSSPAPLALMLKSEGGVVDIALQVWVADVDSKRAILSALQTELYRVLAREGVNLARPELDVLLTQSPAA